MKKSFSLIIIVFFIISGCKKSGRKNRDFSKNKINVVTTIGMIHDLVENIAQNRVNLSGLMGPGIDPHLYKATEGDVNTLTKADVIFYNGLHLESKMGEIFKKMKRNKITVAVSEQIDSRFYIKSKEFQGNPDPHIWFNVELWIKAANAVKETFVKIDPAHKDFYSQNAKNYNKQLIDLHKYVKKQAELIPQDNKVIITAHDAFNYFGQAYGFKVIGIQGISTATEAGIADIKEIASFIVKNKIPAIFIETSVSPKTMKALQEAVSAQNYNVKIGGQLFSDAMGPKGSNTGNYIGMVKHNINTIKNSLAK